MANDFTGVEILDARQIQPPLLGGFHDEAVNAWLKRTELKKNFRQVVGRSLFIHDLLLIINQSDHTIVGM
jgi:hypothetical protein